MSEQRLENGPKPMSGPEAAAGNPSSAHEAARFIATVSLSLGALMLSLFGIIERMVTFQKLAVVNEFALLALLPGIATLAFLACARAISWMISYMTFAQWHAVFPEHRWEETRRLVEESNQFRFRLTLMAGAYLLFTLVITSLAATSAGLAFGLSAPELGMSTLHLLTLWRWHHSRSDPPRDADAGRSSEDSRDGGLRDSVDRDSRVGCCPLTRVIPGLRQASVRLRNPAYPKLRPPVA